MSKNKSATTQFHFNKLSDEDIKEWAKVIVINKVSVKIWSKGDEDNAKKFLPRKYESAKKMLWLGIKTSVFKDGKSDLIGTEIFLQAEWEGVHFFGQTKLLYDEKEKSHYLILEGDFYKSQQRTMLRVKANAELGIKISVEIGEKEYEGSDISFGGSAFYSEDEFEEGQMLEKFSITVDRENFSIPRAKVVKIIDVEDRKMIAINFVKLTHDTEVSLTKKVEALKKKEDKKNSK
jgi:hypothetical protein